MKLKLSKSIETAIYINKLAYELELANPHLSFYEVNILVKKKLEAQAFAKEVQELAEEPLEEAIKNLKAAYGPKPYLKIVK